MLSSDGANAARPCTGAGRLTWFAANEMLAENARVRSMVVDKRQKHWVLQPAKEMQPASGQAGLKLPYPRRTRVSSLAAAVDFLTADSVAAGSATLVTDSSASPLSSARMTLVRLRRKDDADAASWSKL